jgi:hypothetical protein
MLRSGRDDEELEELEADLQEAEGGGTPTADDFAARIAAMGGEVA